MPKSVRSLILVGGLLLLATPCGPGAAQAQEEPPALQPTWYAQALARGTAGLNVTHFWSKGAMLRAETVVAAHKIVTIVRGDWYYAYDGLTNKGLAVRREPAAVALDSPDKRPFGNEYEILDGQGAEKIREEDLLGRKAGVYRVTDQRGKRELWVTLDSARIPLRLEIFDRKSGGRRYTDYVNWQSDLYMPDAFFEPDVSAKLDELDYKEYLRISATKGTVGPVPILYTNLLYTRKDE